MTLTTRDRRILLILVPIVIVIAYWFLLLSPKRDDLSKARDAQHSAEQARDAAVAQAAQLEHARETYAADYAELVRLGKAIPASVDSPSLLVQLSKAANGTHIDFNSVAFGQRQAATAPAPTAAVQGPEQPNGNAAAGGPTAVTGPGRAVESAGNAVNAGNQATSNVNAASGGTTTTTPTTANAPASTTPTAALDSVALTFNFTGTYFDLADFFHRLKRYVYLANNEVFVRGRLLTIDTLAFAPGSTAAGTLSNRLTATVGGTIYLSPASQGVTAGATPAGPPGTTTTPTTTPSGAQTSAVPLAATTP
jgi:hypothetical protein